MNVSPPKAPRLHRQSHVEEDSDNHTSTPDRERETPFVAKWIVAVRDAVAWLWAHLPGLKASHSVYTVLLVVGASKTAWMLHSEVHNILGVSSEVKGGLAIGVGVLSSLFLLSNVFHQWLIYHDIHCLDYEADGHTKHEAWVGTSLEVMIRIAVFGLLLIAAGKVIVGIPASSMAVVMTTLFVTNVAYNLLAVTAGGCEWGRIQEPRSFITFTVSDGIAALIWISLIAALSRHYAGNLLVPTALLLLYAAHLAFRMNLILRPSPSGQ